jgi:hypothetical protein
MPKKFITYLLLFFVPVVLGYVVIEYLTLHLPSGYAKNSEFLNENSNDIKVLVLGSSQMKDAVNAELLKPLTINLASGDQHHNTDFKLLKGLLPQLSNLKAVVLEVSYSHFELPHNSKDFWKNPVYLKYYGVNCFERNTYFKDQLIYLSLPPFYSEKIYDHYIDRHDPAGFNAFGFDTLNYSGRFKDLLYNEAEIAKTRFKINVAPNPKIFKTNTTLFFELLDYIAEQDLQVIICTAPMYKDYLPKRNSEILKRRDSVLSLVSQRYSNVLLLLKEEDLQNFTVKDYWNQSHLNPDGASKFTQMLQQRLDRIN